MKLTTGERVVTAEGGFNPSFQRHVATYRLCAPLLPPGRVLDLGCGVGHSYRELSPRESVGVDISPEALEGQDREVVVADMRALPFGARSFSSVLSVQSLEHVPDAERVLAEVVRVLSPDGVAVFVTPNRLEFAHPDEIIDPYHFVEYSPGELASLCGRYFGSVRVLGLDGSPHWRGLVAEEHARLDQLLRLDPLRLRRLVPRRARQLLYDWLLTRYRRSDDPRAAAVTADDFFLVEDPTAVASSFDLIAVCSAPAGAAR